MTADDEHHAEQTMDISEHLRTWKLFTALVRWSALGIAAVMVLLLIFRTHG